MTRPCQLSKEVFEGCSGFREKCITIGFKIDTFHIGQVGGGAFRQIVSKGSGIQRKIDPFISKV